MSKLNISLFGRFHVDYQGAPVTAHLEARKVQELFAYLLLHRERSHSREALADLLWGENSSAQARKYLRQSLWQLQSALKMDDGFPGDDCLSVDSEWVGINPDTEFALDIREFETAYESVQGRSGADLDPQTAHQLAKAVELHRGNLLEGWYHDWCIFERERLQGMHLAMLNKLMMHFETIEEYEIGLVYGQRILTFDRAHERTHWRMMRLHYLAGDRTAALRQYERCVTALEEELGVKPAKWTASLYDQIKADQLGDETHFSDVSEGSSGQVNRLQSLLVEFQSEVQQYIQASSLSGDRPEGDLSPAE
ncbi:MAG: hypothetical protein IIC23_07120 [Chloroflexi bacterium]|nr:hypothetical protein [Chloroflexota bacterium]